MIILSIVIPAFNSENTAEKLLRSLSSSQKVDFKQMEIIFVDDCSTDATVLKVAEFISSRNNRFSRVKVIKLKNNSGPAKARNIGVSFAKGKVVLFLDADILVYKNTLFEIVRSFSNDPDLYALTGVWDKKQRGDNFFPKFKALRDWSYWINERDPKNYYYLFSTRIAAIDRKLFLRLGGFNTDYKSALVEDIELTYRIARRYAVVFNPKAIVHHEFEGFTKIAKKYFWRSYFWSKIYRKRKKFDPVATTSKEALTTISAAGLAGVVILMTVSKIFRISVFTNYLSVLFWLFFLIHLWGVRKFLRFVRREEGIWFTIKSFITGILLYLVIITGAALSIFEIKKFKIQKSKFKS